MSTRGDSDQRTSLEDGGEKGCFDVGFGLTVRMSGNGTWMTEAGHASLERRDHRRGPGRGTAVSGRGPGRRDRRGWEPGVWWDSGGRDVTTSARWAQRGDRGPGQRQLGGGPGEFAGQHRRRGRDHTLVPVILGDSPRDAGPGPGRPADRNRGDVLGRGRQRRVLLQ